jgi:tyrosine-specific transport protein
MLGIKYMINKKFLGATLLISGACIGAGMLALPIVMASLGLRFSIFLLAGMWLFMCFTGLLVLEINLWFPPNTNYITMAKNTLGSKGKTLTWIIYTLMLYSLLAAYTTVGGELLTTLEAKFLGHGLSLWMSYGIWTLLFALIICAGMGLSETINRLLMVGLIVSFSSLAAIIMPNIHPSLFHEGQFRYILFGLPVVATAFGYHIIIPSIRNYLFSNAKLITWAIILGTLLPFCIYAYWVYLIFGIVPIHGEHGLLTVLHSSDPTQMLTNVLAYITQNPWLGFTTRFFIFFAITSSVIAVSLGLFDLLSDGLKIEKTSLGLIALLLLTFLPPFFYALMYPGGFILALGYAGAFVAILHGILPAAMVWAGRYHYFREKYYQVYGGRIALLLVFSLCSLIIFAEIGDNLHWIPIE